MVKYCMWKRIVNFWNEWAETYRELNRGEVVFFTSSFGGFLYVPGEDDDQSRSVQPEDK